MAGCAMQPMGMAQSGVDISLPSPCGWRQTSSKGKTGESPSKAALLSVTSLCE